MFSDFGYIFIWWLCFFVIGLIFLPLTKKLFANFFDQGYLFAKVLGILFSSYLVWLLASLKIMPFNKEAIWLVLILGLLANLAVSRKTPQTPQPPKFPQSPPIIIFVLEELMFFVTLVFWSYIRGFQPDIQGLEKFMDFGFVNSILRSKYFPPADMWFSGKFINYYYYGHYITAFFTKLSGIDSAITYNLMIGTLFAFCFSLTFSLTGNLIHLWKKVSTKLTPNTQHLPPIITGGLIAAFIISIGANLHPAFYNFKMKILKKPYCDGSFNYWYPNATRYIGVCPDVEDKTIHEFPSYSFIVSDLHGHVSDIPFVFLFLALSLNLFIFLKENKKVLSFEFCALSSLMSLTLAIMFMTNQWDFPIYIIVLGLILLFNFYERHEKISKTLISCFITGCILTLPAIVLILPFQRNFEPFFKGIAFVNAHSRFYQLLILWGVPWFFGVTLLLLLFGHYLKPKTCRFGGFKKENLVKWFSKLLGVDVQFKNTHNPSPLPDTSTPLSAGSLSTSHSIPDLFIIILLTVSLFLIIFPEIFYIKDIYIPSHHRANTVFKLTYQSFMMYSVVIGYIFIRVINSLKKGILRKLIFNFYFLFFISLMVYPWYSIPGYYGKLEKSNYKGLYGLAFLKRLYPDDYEAVLWLNSHIKDQPVVLEAVGDSYTDYQRISMATGLPTIQGWLVHEWLWRGSFDEPGKRSSEVQTIYETKDQNEAEQYLKKYNVKYIVIGEMERTKYPNINEKKFEIIGKKVFENGKTAIYQLY